MNEDEIAKYVMQSIKGPVESSIDRSVSALNAKGFHFIKSEDDPTMWVDTKAGLELDVLVGMSVSCRPQKTPLSAPDQDKKRVEESFYNHAQRHPSSQQAVLASFEGDIANGGFEQLCDNKGIDFLRGAISILQEIGSRGKVRIAAEALRVMECNAGHAKAFRDYQKALLKLDSKYYKSAENIPVLYNRCLTRRCSRRIRSVSVCAEHSPRHPCPRLNATLARNK